VQPKPPDPEAAQAGAAAPATAPATSAAPPPPPPPPPEPKPPEPKPPEPKPEPPKPPEPKPEPPKVVEKPRSRSAKPEPPKQVAKVEEPQKKQKVRRRRVAEESLEERGTKAEESKDKPAKSAPPQQQASSQPANAPLGPQLSTSEVDLIRRQIEERWNAPIGARDAKEMIVVIQVTARRTAPSPMRALSRAANMNDPVYRSAAESARRAVLYFRDTPMRVRSTNTTDGRLSPCASIQRTSYDGQSAQPPLRSALPRACPWCACPVRAAELVSI